MRETCVTVCSPRCSLQRECPVSRRFTFLLAVFVVLLAGCNHWQTVGYNAARTSNNVFETELRVGNVANLQQLWSAADDGSAPPIVAGNTVFVTSTSGLRAYSEDGSTGCSGSPRICQPMW